MDGWDGNLGGLQVSPSQSIAHSYYMFVKLNTLTEHLMHLLEAKLILWPALGLLAQIKKTKYTVPTLHSEFYTGVDQVLDHSISGNVRTRIIVISGEIKIHCHKDIGEKFLRLRCDFPEESFLLSLNDDCSIKETSLSEIGEKFEALPGQYHGFRVKRGLVIVEVEVTNFKTGDIYCVSEIERYRADTAVQKIAA